MGVLKPQSLPPVIYPLNKVIPTNSSQTVLPVGTKYSNVMSLWEGHSHSNHQSILEAFLYLQNVAIKRRLKETDKRGKQSIILPTFSAYETMQ